MRRPVPSSRAAGGDGRAGSAPGTARPGEASGSDRRGAWAMWGLAAAVYFAAAFHRNGLAVASLAAERRFGVGPSVLAALVAVQIGLYALLQIPTGALTDRFGPRRMLSTAAATMAAGELLFAVATSAGEALAGRALVGVGDALTFLSVLRLVQNWFGPRRYGLLTALTALVGGVGQLGSTFPLHVGLVHLGWVPTFGSTALVTAAIGAAVFMGLRDRPAGGPAPAPPRRAGSAVRRVVAVPGTWRGTCAHLTLTGPFVVVTALWGYPFLVRAERFSPAAASAALAVPVGAAVVAAPVVGLILVRAPAWRSRLVYAVAGLLLVSWVAVLAVGPGRDPRWLVVGLLVVTGLGSPGSAPAFDLAREANRPEHGGAATGVVNIGGFTGAVVADVVIGAILAGPGHGGHHPGEFTAALCVVPAMVVVGLAGFWATGRRGRAEVAA